MILLIPSAKTLDFARISGCVSHTVPQFLGESEIIAGRLRRLKVAEMAELMGISEKLARLTVDRYAQWEATHASGAAKQALLAYAGDLYDGLSAGELDEATLCFAQAHLRIISGLYGLLRPLDLIRPYRLEMGTALKVGRAANLYAFWRDRLSAELRRLAEGATVLNLASEEFARAVDLASLKGPVLTPIFQEGRRVVSFYAKRARGRMARFILQHRLEDPEPLKAYREEGYEFVPAESTTDRWIFRRGQA